MQDLLNEKGVVLIGGGLDESPLAYKDINEVMHLQDDMVEILAEFKPKIVRME
jgi:tRNA-splicing ligase RtcB